MMNGPSRNIGVRRVSASRPDIRDKAASVHIMTTHSLALALVKAFPTEAGYASASARSKLNQKLKKPILKIKSVRS